jgi:GDP/UDP-N,N'-diacetylbacillosamine 2-epimerase (hydrolysing)
MKKKICVVTGSRAEFGILLPVMEAIRKHPALALRVVAAGMHLDARHGRTLREVRARLPVAATVPMPMTADTGPAMARAVAAGVAGFSRALDRLRPHWTLVLGDRVEPLAATLASAFHRIPVAHIHGGDRARGGLDDSSRHAITKFAHLHFAATPASALRILRLGERPEHVHIVGAPGIDAIRTAPLPDSRNLLLQFGLNPDSPYLLVVQHPVSTDPESAPRHIRSTLNAVRRTGLQALIVYPNSDAGGQAMIRVIENFRNVPHFRIFKTLEHPTYLSLLRGAAALVGNSSSGIIEAPFFKIPVVNIGTRQQGRERAENVLDCPHDERTILRTIRVALNDRAFRAKLSNVESPYGDGHAAERITGILAMQKITPDFLQKQITY